MWKELSLQVTQSQFRSTETNLNRKWYIPHHGVVDFLCRFGWFKYDWVSGHWQISRHCFRTQNDKFFLEALPENLEFFVLLFHVYRFAVSGYSSAKPKVSRSSLMKWALFFLCVKYVHVAFQKRIWVFWRCRCVFIAYLAFFGAIWPFLRVDLAFFACDYLATLVQRALFFSALSK